MATRVHLGGTPVWVDLSSGTDEGPDEIEGLGPSRVCAVLTAHPGQDACVECRDLCLPSCIVLWKGPAEWNSGLD